MRQAPDVITALGELRTYFAQHNQGAEVTLRLDKDTAMLGFDSKMPGHVPMYQGIDLVGGVGLNIMRLLCGARWTPRALYVPHQAPADPRPYKSLFGCPIHFDADLSVMVFDAAVLQRPISEADEHLHQILANHLSLLQQSYPDSFPDQVKHLIRQALLTGSCSIERVADYLSVTKRTLQRRLSREGVSYKTLLEQVRLDMATRYLLESRASLTELADMLGYSELSAFSNAFKQQTGMSPRQWRAQFAR
jgi:AraC-like DNA-binding protein